MPLIMTLRTILIAAAAPISAPAMLACIPRLASIATSAWQCGPAMSMGV